MKLKYRIPKRLEEGEVLFIAMGIKCKHCFCDGAALVTSNLGIAICFDCLQKAFITHFGMRFQKHAKGKISKVSKWKTHGKLKQKGSIISDPAKEDVLEDVPDYAMEDYLAEKAAEHERNGHRPDCHPLYPGGFCDC